MAETQSNLNMEAVKKFAGDYYAEQEGDKSSHTSAGKSMWNSAKNDNSQRFYALDERRVTL